MRTNITLKLKSEAKAYANAEGLHRSKRKSYENSGVRYVTFLGDEKTTFALRPYCSEPLLSAVNGVRFTLGQHVFPVKPIDNLFVGDLLYARGGVFEQNAIHTAIFLPYFAREKNKYPKRTYVFANLMAKRFAMMSRSDLRLTSKDFANWIVLHEAFHNSGPAPLFSKSFNKFKAKSYGFVEELRVDLSIIYFILSCITLPDAHDLHKIVELILADRLFRAARFHFNKTHKPKFNMYAKEVEGDAAICLMVLLNQHGLFNLKSGELVLAPKRLLPIVRDVLNDIYTFEMMIKDENSFVSSYPKFAEQFRARYFQINNDILRFLKASARTNCHYHLGFEVCA